MDQAIEYAKLKIAKFPEVYKDYVDNLELFNMLVEDCRKQLEFERVSINFIRIGGVERESAII